MCIFCRIASGELPASVVYEDESTIAFLDIQPINPGHVLVVPKAHAESLVDLSPEDAAQVMRVGRLMDKALRASELHCEGVNLFIADGKAAGQEVGHVHLHVFPRFEEDGFKIHLESSERATPGREQLNETATKLKRAVDSL
ncbi:MAG: HIT family protein [Anaerolineaceae bacterium]|nr:HIT family protein [Anaerolineaceae bacterium]